MAFDETLGWKEPGRGNAGVFCVDHETMATDVDDAGPIHLPAAALVADNSVAIASCSGKSPQGSCVATSPRESLHRPVNGYFSHAVHFLGHHRMLMRATKGAKLRAARNN